MIEKTKKRIVTRKKREEGVYGKRVFHVIASITGSILVVENNSSQILGKFKSMKDANEFIQNEKNVAEVFSHRSNGDVKGRIRVSEKKDIY